MKRQEISKGCALCNKGVMHKNQISFYRITLDHFIVDLKAIQRVHGLEQYFGVAYVMGTDNNLANKMSTVNFLICDDCMFGELIQLLVIKDKILEE